LGIRIDDLDSAFEEVLAALAREDSAPLARYTRLRPPVVSWAPPSSELPVPLLRDCLLHWNSLRTGRPLPDWRDFRTEDFRHAVTRASIVDPVPGTDDMRYRIIGSRLAEYIGHDWEGATVREMARARRSIGPLLAHAVYVLAYRRRLPVYTWHSRAAPGARLEGWHRLILPFSAPAPGDIRFVSVVEVDGAAQARPAAARSIPSWQPRTLPAPMRDTTIHK
jgi:hypothetical protein